MRSAIEFMSSLSNYTEEERYLYVSVHTYACSFSKRNETIRLN